MLQGDWVPRLSGRRSAVLFPAVVFVGMNKRKTFGEEHG